MCEAPLKTSGCASMKHTILYRCVWFLLAAMQGKTLLGRQCEASRYLSNRPTTCTGIWSPATAQAMTLQCPHRNLYNLQRNPRNKVPAAFSHFPDKFPGRNRDGAQMASSARVCSSPALKSNMLVVWTQPWCILTFTLNKLRSFTT